MFRVSFTTSNSFAVMEKWGLVLHPAADAARYQSRVSLATPHGELPQAICFQAIR
jgi:hypothetical protein